MDVALWCLLVPLASYPLGCQAYIITSMVSTMIVPEDIPALQAKIRRGMTPAEVEAVVGWPSEDTDYYGSIHNEAHFLQRWTVRGYGLQVTFIDGRVAEWQTWPVHGPEDDFFQQVFFWWMPEMD
ncbi:MAG TPA: hypothetical protein VGX68_07895 [Thermoanaerobaculia bacterium]|nr:hypothetical protein [Thermoanaerobaculia bacterium]